MPKSNFIPTADDDFLVWFDHFIAQVALDIGLRLSPNPTTLLLSYQSKQTCD